MSQEDNKGIWLKAVRELDGFLVPVSFGVLAVLVLAQSATAIPAVRQGVDRIEGRFVTYPSSQAYLSQAEQSAVIKLYLSPDNSQSNVQVNILVNGSIVGHLRHGSLAVKVQSGDKLSFVGQNLQQTVDISVDHNNPALLRPAPGRTVVLSPQQSEATLAPVQFLK